MPKYPKGARAAIQSIKLLQPRGTVVLEVEYTIMIPVNDEGVKRTETVYESGTVNFPIVNLLDFLCATDEEVETIKENLDIARNNILDFLSNRLSVKEIIEESDAVVKSSDPVAPVASSN